MKHRHLLGVGILLTAALLTSCEDTSKGLSKGYGAFNPTIGLDTKVINGADTRAVPISAADLSLKLTNSEGTIESSWEKVGDFDTSKKYPVGEYTLEAYWGNVNEEGYELPHYYGTTKFNILEDKETTVALTAKLGNGLISTHYTDAFTDYMEDGSWSSSVRSAGGATTEVPGEESRPVYVKPGPAVVSVTFTKANGNKGTFQAATIDVQPRTHYEVTFDVDAGNAALVVTFTDEMESREVIIDISERVFAAPEPQIVAQGFENGQAVEFIENTVPDIELAMAITAIAGIKEVHLTSVSDYLTLMDFPNDLDLVSATSEEKEAITANALDVKGLWKNMEEMALIDFSALANLLPAGTTHTFTVTVTDVLDRITEPMELVVSPTELILNLTQASERLLGADTKVYMEYNGPDPAKTVTFEMQNERGTFDKVRPLELVAAPEKGEGFYLVTLPTTESELSSVYFRAACSNRFSNDLELKLKPPFFQINVNPVDVFSTTAKATISLLPDATEELPSISECEFLISRVGVSAYTKYTFDELIQFTNLRVNTGYEVWVQYAGMRSEPAQFTTETQPQLTNGDLDSEVITVTSRTNWAHYEFLGWGTVNGLTTSPGDGSGAGQGARYKSNSGTSQTRDAHNGTAALIRTVGWGTGNTATASLTGGFGTCQNVTAGELFLGTNWIADDEPNTYGIEFEGRPQTISFWYKYTEGKSGNGDYGYYEVSFYGPDSAEPVFSATGQLPAKPQYDQYEQITVTPKYTGKVNKLVITFKSTGRTDALKANSTWMTPPPAWNLTTGEYVGSSLYIDEIELTY